MGYIISTFVKKEKFKELETLTQGTTTRKEGFSPSVFLTNHLPFLLKASSGKSSLFSLQIIQQEVIAI